MGCVSGGMRVNESRVNRCASEERVHCLHRKTGGRQDCFKDRWWCLGGASEKRGGHELGHLDGCGGD